MGEGRSRPPDCGAPVPARYVGLWRRRLLETPDGGRDTETQVMWLQTDALYADLRVPAHRPDFTGARSLADCNAGQRAWLARQQGFAGILRVDGDTCTWERALDFQPPPASPDAGRMAFDGSLLIEHGIHAPYLEEWQRVQAAGDDVLALRLVKQASDGHAGACTGVLVALKDFFLYVLDRRPVPAPPLSSPNLELEISLGLRRGGDRPWQIVLSTQPWREREAVFDARRPPRIESDQYIETLPDGTIRRWSICQQGAAFRWRDH